MGSAHFFLAGCAMVDGRGTDGRTDGPTTDINTHFLFIKNLDAEFTANAAFYISIACILI